MNRINVNSPSSEQLPSGAGQVTDSRSMQGQSCVEDVDMTNVVSQVLHSPALNSVLTGVSEQTGVGSPNILRNMLQQLTQSPQMMNTVNQIAHQFEGQDVGNMFAGMGGQGGGFDLSRMFQQMMPIVSQALGSSSTTPQTSSVLEPQPSRDQHTNQSSQVFIYILTFTELKLCFSAVLLEVRLCMLVWMRILFLESGFVVLAVLCFFSYTFALVLLVLNGLCLLVPIVFFLSIFSSCWFWFLFVLLLNVIFFATCY